MKIPFIKAHGAGNDFVFTFSRDLPGTVGLKDFPEIAKAICHRNTGVGADGWYIVDRIVGGAHAAVRLWNSDGSKAELSGNGTRCACAILVDQGLAPSEVHVATGSGIKIATLQRRDADGYWFEMEMGIPTVAAGNLHTTIGLTTGQRDATIIDVGNPQCSIAVDDFDFDWKREGDELENHRRFAPAKTNVSFFVKVGDRAIDVRFWERGAHHTLSSGTGSVGAAVTAMLRGMVESPVTVQTEFCPMTVRWDRPQDPVYLTGPACIIASGEFHYGG